MTTIARFRLLPLARHLSAALLLTTAAACSAGRATIPLSPGLSGATALPVQGRQGWQLRPTYRFGDFAATNIRKGWLATSGWGAPVFGGSFSQNKTRRKSSFELHPPGQPAWQVRSAYYALDRSLSFPASSVFSLTLDHQEVYSSTIECPGQRPWQLVMRREQQPGKIEPVAGVLSNGEQTLQVRAVHQLLRKDGRPMNFPVPIAFGYEFVQPNGTVIGAVEVIDNGRVWLAPALPPALHGPVAAAATALLLAPGSDQ